MTLVALDWNIARELDHFHWSVFGRVHVSCWEMHLLIWVKSRAGDHLALALAAVAVAGVAGCEMQMIAVDNPADFARIIRWIMFP